MTFHRRRLDRWLRQQAFGHGAGRLARLIIKHSAQGARGTQVEQITFDQVTTEDIALICEQVESTIRGDAAGLGGVQRYLVEAYHEDSDQVSARFAMRVEGHDPDIDGVDDVDAEPATKGGILAQQMRHNEVLMKTLVSGIAASHTSLTRQLAITSGHLEKLMEQRLEEKQVVENALSHQHEREIEMLAAAEDLERKKLLTDKGLSLLPVIVNRLTGNKVLPGAAASPSDEMLKTFVSSLTPEQAGQLQMMLGVEQRILLLEIIKTIKEKGDSGRTNNGQPD